MTRRFPLLVFPLLTAAVLAGCGGKGSSPSTSPGSTSTNALSVPSGFNITPLAQGLSGPRRIAIAPGGTAKRYDVFVSESSANRVSVLRVNNGATPPVQKFTFAEGLNQPYGLAFWGDWLYVGNTNQVVRYAYKSGALAAAGSAKVVAPLTQGGYNNHWTRNLLVSPDAKQIYVSVGSSCNTCEESDPQRAAISRINPDGSGKTRVATGLRNPVGMAIRPGTNELWTVVNERDNLGDDVPPDFLTKVEDGHFYGWPYAYTDIAGQIHPDPNFGAKSPDKVKNTTAPSVPVQAHSAALGLAFYPTKVGAGAKAFPSEFSGDAFLAFHGSWNRSKSTGYKIVRVNFENGQPGAVSDFVTGFLRDGGSVWGRPVDVQIAPDGALLFSDDKGGDIWRVAAK